MDNVQKETVDDCMASLADNIDYNGMINYLLSRRFLKQHHVETIKQDSLSLGRNYNLICTLKVIDDGWRALCEGLHHCNQKEILRNLKRIEEGKRSSMTKEASKSVKKPLLERFIDKIMINGNTDQFSEEDSKILAMQLRSLGTSLRNDSNKQLQQYQAEHQKANEEFKKEKEKFQKMLNDHRKDLSNFDSSLKSMDHEVAQLNKTKAEVQKAIQELDKQLKGTKTKVTNNYALWNKSQGSLGDQVKNCEKNIRSQQEKQDEQQKKIELLEKNAKDLTNKLGKTEKYCEDSIQEHKKTATKELKDHEVKMTKKIEEQIIALEQKVQTAEDRILVEMERRKMELEKHVSNELDKFHEEKMKLNIKVENAMDIFERETAELTDIMKQLRDRVEVMDRDLKQESKRFKVVQLTMEQLQNRHCLLTEALERQKKSIDRSARLQARKLHHWKSGLISTLNGEKNKLRAFINHSIEGTERRLSDRIESCNRQIEEKITMKAEVIEQYRMDLREFIKKVHADNVEVNRSIALARQHCEWNSQRSNNTQEQKYKDWMDKFTQVRTEMQTLNNSFYKTMDETKDQFNIMTKHFHIVTETTEQAIAIVFHHSDSMQKKVCDFEEHLQQQSRYITENQQSIETVRRGLDDFQQLAQREVTELKSKISDLQRVDLRLGQEISRQQEGLDEVYSKMCSLQEEQLKETDLFGEKIERLTRQYQKTRKYCGNLIRDHRNAIQKELKGHEKKITKKLYKDNAKLRGSIEKSFLHFARVIGIYCRCTWKSFPQDSESMDEEFPQQQNFIKIALLERIISEIRETSTNSQNAFNPSNRKRKLKTLLEALKFAGFNSTVTEEEKQQWIVLQNLWDRWLGNETNTWPKDLKGSIEVLRNQSKVLLGLN